MAIQSLSEIEEFYSTSADPWSYFSTPDDQIRKSTLLANLPNRKFKRVLDIGCGNGFLTVNLPGAEVIGLDISSKAVQHAKEYANKLNLGHVFFQELSLFEIPRADLGEFDLIVITGVLYEQYIGRAATTARIIIDDLLKANGILASCHIDEWNPPRFPYVNLDTVVYPYRNYSHRLEVYVK